MAGVFLLLFEYPFTEREKLSPLGMEQQMQNPIQRYLSLLATYLRPLCWCQAFLLSTLLIVSTGFQFLNPQILKYFIDTALVGNATSPLLILEYGDRAMLANDPTSHFFSLWQAGLKEAYV